MTALIKTHKVIYNATMLVSHRGSSRGYKTDFICHVILQVHTIKGSCDFMGRCPSK